LNKPTKGNQRSFLGNKMANWPSASL